MSRIRFLLDDAQQCNTQQAVISLLANDLEQRALGEVLRSSRLTELRSWTDVSPESSVRLALRLMALDPTPGLRTFFLPGHIVPGSITSLLSWEGALTVNGFSSVADLDLFGVDNAHPDIQRLHDFVAAHSDYEAISRYADFSLGSLPNGLLAGGLTSVLPLSQRPWYSVYAPTRAQWLAWVRRALDQGLLNVGMVEEDVQMGRVRPSVLHEVKALHLGIVNPPPFDVPLDSLFSPPERRLTDGQLQFLRSTTLQKRTARYATQKKGGKLSKPNLRQHTRGLLKRLLRAGIRFVYRLYSMTLGLVVRPLRVKLRD